ncbi:MAG TPA: S46 family peptidase, partial [Pyrinomonadaceae bacterium]
AQGEEQTRRAQNELNSVENAIKVYKGQLAGLQDKALIERKQKAEAALRKSISSNQHRQKEYGDAWDAISKGRKALATYERERRILEAAAGFNSILFTKARQLVRMAAESEKPDAERLPEFTQAKRESLESELFSPAPIYDDFEKLKLADSLAFMVEVLGENHAVVKRALNGKTPEARAAELVDGTKLKDPAFRKQLAAGGLKAIESSDDPMIQLARSIDKEAREVRKRYEEEVVGVERTGYSKIARALFETEGTNLYPDATFTLRLAYGAVKGYMENGQQIPAFTTLGGLYDRAAKFEFKFPYNLPPRWVEKKAALDLKTPFNFVSTTDTTGGNSGSPTINKNGELVGVLFDGNIQSLIGNFSYDESVNRSIHVDSRGMLEVLRKVFGANELADELTKG